VVHALDRALRGLGLDGNRVALVTDIGCSGLLDVFFKTHAFHGLHGRALTYATGLKMARPDLHVIVVMGDGGLGIGGAHFLSACRRNLDLTLLVLNNFNYGMTGGQYSTTTPDDAVTASGFLNRLEAPLDICRLAEAAGVPYACRTSAFSVNLAKQVEAAIGFSGFAVMDIQGICTGRYTRKNKLTPSLIEERIAKAPVYDGPVVHNQRKEYGKYYREYAAKQKNIDAPRKINPVSVATVTRKTTILILGRAGQKIATAGEVLALAGIAGGLSVSQKISHDITVLRGASISEVILQTQPIGFTGIGLPDVILALGREGIKRKSDIWADLPPETLILKAQGVDIPACKAEMKTIDFKKFCLKERDWALAALGLLAGEDRIITMLLLKEAINTRFKGDLLDNALKIAFTLQ
jgi:pyruvate/2-oxoacid:ferredoxin oxidoreductase beta subunit/Pyruvate/2-oxoacid:ferredoxin oxidoreductase gamma subunit